MRSLVAGRVYDEQAAKVLGNFIKDAFHLGTDQLKSMLQGLIELTARRRARPVSSTEVRQRLVAGDTPAALAARGVLAYIRDHGLYRGQ